MTAETSDHPQQRHAGNGPDTGRHNRIGSLDVLRGIAIAGTFGTNVWIIAAAGGAAGFAISDLDSGGTLERVLRAIPNGKFLALLTLLFGIGLELQYRAALRRGLRWPGRYLRRAGILLAEGFLHYLLVFEYDVLMGYAIASVIVAYLVGRSAETIARTMKWVSAGYLFLIALTTAGLLLAPDAARPAGTLPDTASWPRQVAHRLQDFLLYRAETIFIVPSAVLLFLAGALLLRNGVFADDPRGRRLRTRLMGWCFGIGVPLHVATTWAGSGWFFVERYVCGPLIALGLLGAITAATLRAAGPISRGCTAIGRTALSCYVMQNVLACVLCYDWGLGLTGRLAALGAWWPVLLWCGVVAVNAGFAWWWLRGHARGPLESLAHRFA